MGKIVGGLTAAKPDMYDVIIGGEKSYDPMTLPLFMTLKKLDKPTSPMFDFSADLADEPNSNGQAEGGSIDSETVTKSGKPTRLHGRVQHYKEFISVGEVTADDEGFARSGMKEYDYQKTKKTRLLAKRIELSTIGANESKEGNGVEPFQTRGLETWILPTSLIGLQTDTPTQVKEDFRPTAAQVKQLTFTSGNYTLAEQDILDVLNAQWNALGGAGDYDVYCTLRFKTKISNLGVLATVNEDELPLRRFNQDATTKILVNTIDKYQGDAGTYTFRQHPLMRKESKQKAEAIAINDMYVGYRSRKEPVHKPIADRGAGPEGYVMATLGVQCNPKFLGQWREAA